MSEVDDGIVDIHGKQYQTVALRLKQMRGEHADWAVATKLLSIDDDTARFKASIKDAQGRVIATGHAEEKRSASQINQSSALENCETSAVGRALANAGYLTTDIASADEMEEHRADQIAHGFVRYLNTVRKHWDSIVTYKASCAMGDRERAAKVLNQVVSEDDMRILWRAPSRGSVFETVERDRNGTGRKEDPDAHERQPDNVKMQ